MTPTSQILVALTASLLLGMVKADAVCQKQDGSANECTGSGCCTCTAPKRPLIENFPARSVVHVRCLEECPLDGKTENTRMGCICLEPDNIHKCTEKISGQKSDEDLCTCAKRPSCELEKDYYMIPDSPCRCPCGSRQKNAFEGKREDYTYRCIKSEGATGCDEQTDSDDHSVPANHGHTSTDSDDHSVSANHGHNATAHLLAVWILTIFVRIRASSV